MFEYQILKKTPKRVQTPADKAWVNFWIFEITQFCGLLFSLTLWETITLWICHSPSAPSYRSVLLLMRRASHIDKRAWVLYRGLLHPMPSKRYKMAYWSRDARFSTNQAVCQKRCIYRRDFVHGLHENSWFATLQSTAEWNNEPITSTYTEMVFILRIDHDHSI